MFVFIRYINIGDGVGVAPEPVLSGPVAHGLQVTAGSVTSHNADHQSDRRHTRPKIWAHFWYKHTSNILAINIYIYSTLHVVAAIRRGATAFSHCVIALSANENTRNGFS